MPFTRWHLRARVIMGSATFFDAFDALSLAFVLPVLVRQWGISAGADRLAHRGRISGPVRRRAAVRRARRAIRTRAAARPAPRPDVGDELVCALTGSFPALLAARLVQGIGVGGEMPVAAVYINELSRAHGRGRFFLLYEMIFPIGLMVTGQIGALVVPMFGWQVMFLIGGIPGLVIAGLLLRLPESPRWLIGKGRLAEAEAIIQEIEASTTNRNERRPDRRTRAPLTEPSHHRTPRRRTERRAAGPSCSRRTTAIARSSSGRSGPPRISSPTA